MKPRGRTILKVITLLAAGAAVNFLVACGCALCAEIRAGDGEGTIFSRQVFPNYRGQDIPEDFRYNFWRVGRGISIHEGLQTEPLIYLRSISAGWPKRSFNGSLVNNQHALAALKAPKWMARTGPTRPARFIPLRPIWPGFAVNTVFYAGVLWVSFCGPFALRRMIRRRRGQCAHCAYPIGQNERCTECGASLGKSK